MNKTALFALVGIIVIAGGAYLIIGRGGAPTSQEANVTSRSEQKSISELIASGVPQKCAFESTDETSANSGTVYVGNGAMRGDFTSPVDDKIVMSHMIIRDNKSYIWMDDTTTGFMTALNAPAPQTQTQPNSVDADQKLNYSCESWSVDASLFNLPTTVTFSDLSALTGTDTGDTDLKAIQCAACDRAPE